MFAKAVKVALLGLSSGAVASRFAPGLAPARAARRSAAIPSGREPFQVPFTLPFSVSRREGPMRYDTESTRMMAAVGEAPKVKVGDLIPDVSLDSGFPPEKVSLRELTKGRKVVLVGLPGAFTPT